jgi:transcriptional regulator with XRE-family HTH domain
MTGEELRKVRTQLELTQEELGERLGVRKNTVWRWENEQRRVPETVARLVQYLAKEVRAEQKKRKKT